MTETTIDADSSPSGPPPSSDKAPANKPARKDENFLFFLVKLVLIVGIFRSFILAPFNIPSESMQPRLLVGDYLLAAKWPYGYSSYSLPFNLPLISGRIFAQAPHRGDVVIFKAPPLNDVDYIKRVIGLPGDTVQMIGGQLHLNGTPVPKIRISDLEVEVSPNTHCYAPPFEKVKPDGTHVCDYPRYQETVPDGTGGAKNYDVLDLAQTPQDDTAPILVPEGSLFLMGDNRDNSMDSRFPAVPGEGVGLVPQANLVGRAEVMMWSTDGSAVWYEPWTWLTATRWSRIGGRF